MKQTGKPDKIDSLLEQLQYPIGSIYGIFHYIWLISMVTVGKYTIHGWFGYQKKKNASDCGCTNQATPSRQKLHRKFSDPRVSKQKFCPRFSGTGDQID